MAFSKSKALEEGSAGRKSWSDTASTTSGSQATLIKKKRFSSFSFTPATEKQHLQSRPRGCCRRFWWAWLLGTIVLIATALSIVLFAVIPRVTRDIISSSTFTITSLRLQNATASTINVSLAAEWSFDSAIRLESAGLEMRLVDYAAPVFEFDIDEVNASKHGTNPVRISTEPREISMTPEIELLMKRLQPDGQSARLKLRMETGAWFGKLPNGVKVEKELKVKGFSESDGMEIKSSS